VAYVFGVEHLGMRITAGNNEDDDGTSIISGRSSDLVALRGIAQWFSQVVFKKEVDLEPFPKPELPPCRVVPKSGAKAGQGQPCT
jgi:hypothetical protein